MHFLKLRIPQIIIEFAILIVIIIDSNYLILQTFCYSITRNSFSQSNCNAHYFAY